MHFENMVLDSFNFILKHGRLEKTNSNCKLSFVQTLSELLSLFYFYDMLDYS